MQSFGRFYSFLAQIMPFTDVELEKFFLYGKYLLKVLPKTRREDRFTLGDEVSLEYYRLQKIAEQNILMDHQEIYEFARWQ